MNKKTLYALGVFVFLAAVYFAGDYRGSTPTAAPTWSIPALKDTADAIEITREGEKIALAKKDGAWRLTAPIDFPAADKTVSGLLDVFAETVGVDLMIPVQADELARYELDAAKGIPVTISGGGKTLASFVVGKVTGKRTFVKPADEMVVYRAKASLRFKVDKVSAEWRNKKIFSVERDDVVKLVLHHPETDGGAVTLERDSKAGVDGAGTQWIDTWRITSPLQEPADKSTVSSLLGSVTNLRAADFADNVKSADAGFAPDSFRVTAHLKEGKGDPQTVVFGGLVGADRLDGRYTDDFFARREGSEAVYVVRKYTLNNSKKKAADLRTKEVFSGLKREQIVSLSVETKAGKLSFSRDGAHWQATEPSELAGVLDESPLNSLLSSLANLRAARVLGRVDDTTGGFAAADRAARVTMTLNEGAPKILLVGKLADEAKKEWYARLENSPAPVWILRDYVVRQMTKDAEGFKKKS